MPFKYFSTASRVRFIPKSDEDSQSTNPFAPGYKRPHGKYYYPPEFYKIRPTIVSKFDYRCFICGGYGDEVHHIDYNRMNNEESNFCLLCKSCHLGTNANRDYWKKRLANELTEFEEKNKNNGEK